MLVKNNGTDAMFASGCFLAAGKETPMPDHLRKKVEALIERGFPLQIVAKKPTTRRKPSGSKRS
jgi:hypothetical protein